MEQKQITKTEQQSVKTMLLLNEEPIEVNGKIIRKPFMVSVPSTSNDFRVLCEMLEPSFISTETAKFGGRDFVSAVAYKIDDYYRIRSEFMKRSGQTNLTKERLGYQMMNYLDATRLKIIDPNTESLRIGKLTGFNEMIKLPKLPEYFRKYIIEKQKIKGSKTEKSKKNERIHLDFWSSLFEESKTGRKQGVAHFISWNNDIQSNMQSDIFLPPVPFIKNKDDIKNMFIKYTKEINDTSFQLYGESAAMYVILDMSLFRDSKAIDQIASIISEAPNKFIILKILGINKMTEPTFGYYARKNLEFFLKTLNDIRCVKPEKIVGLLDGGGFGYCLLGTCVDFFTDTVSNAYQDTFPRNTGKHRSLLHPLTFVPENIEGVLQQLSNHKSLFMDCIIADKYKGMDKEKFLSTVDKIEWSMDCRRMGIIMWQKRMAALMNTDKIGLARMRFDEIINSGFPFLGTIIKKIINGS